MMAPLAPLAPALGLMLYFLGALAIYAVRNPIIDPEIAARPASPLIGRWLRNYLMWVLSPCERWLVRLRVAPSAVTLASLGMAIGAAWALARDCFALGGWLYLAAGICDILDGRIARLTGRVSAGGAYFDSVIDRYAELAVFCGLAFFYRTTPVAAIVVAAAIGSFMVSYARARGESLGADVSIGTMQRPERLFYLGVIIAHCPFIELFLPPAWRPAHPAAVLALMLLAISSNATAIQRILHTLRHLDGPTPSPGIAKHPPQRLLDHLRTAG